MRTFYFVNHGLPYSTNGYSVRTHQIAFYLRINGFDLFVNCNSSGSSQYKDYQLQGIRYLYLPFTTSYAGIHKTSMTSAVSRIEEHLKVFKPSILLAASNWKIGLPVSRAATQLGIPFYYDVRGFWEISKAAQNPAWSDSARFKEEVYLETEVASAATRVFTISSIMREELVRRGVDRNKIDIVQNGFIDWPRYSTNLAEDRSEFLNKAKIWVGYIGSFGVYEGLENLIHAVATIRKQGVDVGLLLLGSGQPSGLDVRSSTLCAATLKLRALADALGIGHVLVSPGRTTPEEAALYYPLIDLVVIPRKPLPVAELVTPLKPIEAASHGKRVLMSNVAPLAELGPDYPNFFYFEKGNQKSLEIKLYELLTDLPPELPRYPGLEKYKWENTVTTMVEALRAVGPGKWRI